MKDLDYEIIGTGSSGNCVRIGHVLIDCGLSYKKIEHALPKVDTLLITHSHQDHLKENTYISIKKHFPRIKTYGNYDIAYRVPVDNIIGENRFKIKRRNTYITPITGVHDVPVTYFYIEMNGMDIFYATDTSEVHTANDEKYDYIFCESNYDQKKLEQVYMQYAKHGYDPYANAMRHLSYQKCMAFYFLNRKSKDSVLVELHQSKRFR